MKKKVLILYQDWDNWFEKDYFRFEHWVKYQDEAMSIDNDHLIFSLGNKNRKFKLEDNVRIQLYKSTPKTQFLDIFKIRKELKKVINEYKPDIIFCPFSYVSVYLPKNNKAKVICSLGEKVPESLKSKGFVSYLASYVFYYIEYLAFKRYDIIFYNGESLRKYAKSLGYKNKFVFSPRRIVGIENVKKAKKGIVKEKLNLKNKKIILTVCRLAKEKNVELGIKALAKLPKKYVYVILGKGEELDNLKSLAKELGVLNRVYFQGHVNRVEIWNYFIDSDVQWLLSSHDFEGTPNVIQEGMYSGVPSIVSKISAMKNIVKNNHNGLILKNYDENELANKTLKYEKDNKFKNKVIKNGKLTANDLLQKHKRVQDYY